MTTAPPANRHSDDVRVARVHLRLGQLTLARAELEDLLRRNALDGQAMAALAEARWRTGDAVGAADAAFTHLEAGGADDVALCIAAETAASEGRATEARALMDRLPAADAATLDALFAGMPRRAFWPAGPVDRSDLDELRRGADGRGAGRAAPGPSGLGPPPNGSAEALGRASSGGVPRDVRSVPGPRDVIEATSGTAWDAGAPPAAEGGQPQVERTPRPADPPGPAAEGPARPPGRDRACPCRAREPAGARVPAAGACAAPRPDVRPRRAGAPAPAPRTQRPRSSAATPSACWADISKPRPRSMRPRRAWRSRDRAHPRPRQARRRAAPACRPDPRALRGARAQARRLEADDRRPRPRRAALRRPSREAVLPRPRRLHHERPARRGGPRGPERHLDRSRDERRDPAARGSARLDPRRLRGRDSPEPGPRVRQRRRPRPPSSRCGSRRTSCWSTNARSIAGCSHPRSRPAAAAGR